MSKSTNDNYWPIEELSISEVYLDKNNVRIPDAEIGQDALIQDLFSNEDAFELVKSFVQNGIFSDEYPIVVHEDGKVIVIEGNRRLAALKALNTPELVPKFEQKIKSLKHQGFPKIRVTVAPNREAAIKHIANKHTINYRRPWKPLRQAYFYKSLLDNGKKIDELKTEYQEHDIPKFIRMLDMHRLARSIDYSDEAVKQRVANERSFPITNLERLYEKPDVQDFLHIKFNEHGQVEGGIELEEFYKPYRKIIEDVANGVVDSRKRNTAKQISKYIEEFPDEAIPDTTKKGHFGAKDAHVIKVKKVSTKSKSTRKPKGLFSAGNVPYRLNSEAVKAMYIELKDLDVATFPNAANDLLRSFLECALIAYFKSTGEFKRIPKSGKHNPKLAEILGFIISGKSSIDDANVISVVGQIKSDYTSPYSLVRLNMINHNENWTATESDVRTAWSKMESLFKIILSNPSDAKDSK